VTLSDADIRARKHIALQNEFEVLFFLNQWPKDAAMFDKRDSTLGEHDFYFSPGAARIAKALIKSYAGGKCPAPDDASLELLVGYVGS
jgi:hypothetical protein